MLILLHILTVKHWSDLMRIVTFQAFSLREVTFISHGFSTIQNDLHHFKNYTKDRI